MKIAAVGDPHGATSELDDDIDAIFLTGDLGFDREQRSMYSDAKRSLPADIAEYRDRALRAMQYRANPPASEEKTQAAINMLLDSSTPEEDEVLTEGYRQARDVLDHYASYDVPIYVTQGNWDFDPITDDYSMRELVQEYDSVHDVTLRNAELGDYTVVGYGTDRFDTGPESLDDPGEYTGKRDILQFRMERADGPTILLSHNVPFDSGLDVLDIPVGGLRGKPNGSNVLNDVLDDRDVLFAAGGHIHEGHGAIRVKGTPVINAGQNDVTYVTLDEDTVTGITS